MEGWSVAGELITRALAEGLRSPMVVDDLQGQFLVLLLFVGGAFTGIMVALIASRGIGTGTPTVQPHAFPEADLHAQDWDPTTLNTDGTTLMTDAERVIRLLIAHNGSMHQSSVVSATEWSSAKVSRVLQRMEQRGDITRVRVGRSNVVFLGDVEAELETQA